MVVNQRRSLFELVECREADIALPQEEINHDSLYAHLACTHVLDQHAGCVNALDWSDDGTLLASGSDDRHVALWRHYDTSMCTAFDVDGVNILRAAAYYDTGCRGNIFGVKFLPGESSKLVSVAADASAHLAQIRDDGTITRLARREDNHGRVHKVDVDPCDAHWFVTASEDGTLREYDIRTMPTQSGRILATWAHENVNLNSVSVSPVRPELVACCGHGPVVRVIDRRFVKPLDARPHSMTTEAKFTWMPVGYNLHSNLATSVKFNRHSMDLVTSLINDSIYQIHYDAVTSGHARFENTPHLDFDERTYQELASIWTDAVTKTRHSRPRPEHLDRETESENEDANANEDANEIESNDQFNRHGDQREESETLLGDPEQWFAWSQSSLSEGHPFKSYFRKLGDLIVAHRKMQYELDPVLCTIYSYNCHNLILASLRCRGVQTMEPLASDLFLNNVHAKSTHPLGRQLCAVGLLASKDPALARLARDIDRLTLDQALRLQPIDVLRSEEWQILKQQSRMCTCHHREYRDHVNEKTVKDVNFVGPRHEYITSGSDGGVFFIWNSEKRPIFIGRSDNSVVNCVTENPRLPIIAVSGVDSTIKLWEPKDPSREVGKTNRWHALTMKDWSQIAYDTLGGFELACPMQ